MIAARCDTRLEDFWLTREECRAVANDLAVNLQSARLRVPSRAFSVQQMRDRRGDRV